MLQPPSGGCVLKLTRLGVAGNHEEAATFGWLCVETSKPFVVDDVIFAATFGWLCVETKRLRVRIVILNRSHLRVAVC